MLVTLNAMKDYLGISLVDTSHDVFLSAQIAFISEVVEAYCQRKFESNEYVETHYADAFCSYGKLRTYQYPVISIDSVSIDGEDFTQDELDLIRVHKKTGSLDFRKNYIGWGFDGMVLSYTAGFAVIPPVIQNVVMSLVEERYNKNASGISLNFGSDVQSISIPGTVSVAFDYSLTSNNRESGFGVILGSYLNALDFYRSDRALIASSEITYIEEV